MSKLCDDTPPSYAESTTSVSQPLSQHVASRRNQHILTVITTRIIPQLKNRADRGLSKSTLVLKPSAHSTVEKGAPEQDVGLADNDESYETVILDEPLDTDEFWTQPEVLTELKRQLDESFRSGGSLEPEEEALPPRQEERRGLFGRKKPVPPPEPPRKQPGRFTVSVQVGLEDMGYRVENEYGLLDTITREVLVVRVDTRA